MSASSNSSSYSVFWPLQFLVVCLGIGMVFHLYQINRDRLATERDIHQLTPRGSDALQAKNRFFALVKEINQLAKQDGAAAQLLTELNIQVRPDATTPAGGK